jgi:hypothetical protein
VCRSMYCGPRLRTWQPTQRAGDNLRGQELINSDQVSTLATASHAHNPFDPFDPSVFPSNRVCWPLSHPYRQIPHAAILRAIILILSRFIAADRYA